MENVTRARIRLASAIALACCAMATGPVQAMQRQATAGASHAMRADLLACRFALPGRGDRLLNRPAHDQAVEACLARLGYRIAAAPHAH